MSAVIEVLSTEPEIREQKKALREIAALEKRCAGRKETMRYLEWARSRVEQDPLAAPRVLLILGDIRAELRRGTDWTRDGHYPEARAYAGVVEPVETEKGDASV
jgi:hypothetical protein